MSINVTLTTENSTQEALIPLNGKGILHLREAVIRSFGQHLKNRNFILTDTLKDVTKDEDVHQLRDGSKLVVALSKDGKLTAPARERICFQPHPKTLTMAGDYEYFAAQVSLECLVTYDSLTARLLPH